MPKKNKIKKVNIGFSQMVGDNPTWFVDKVWDGIEDINQEEFNQYRDAYIKHFGKSWSKGNPNTELQEPKIHTIRVRNKKKDGTYSTYWENKEGFFARMFVWKGKPYRSKQLQFALLMEVKKVQRIEIKHQGSYKSIFIDNKVVYGNYFPLKIESKKEKQALLKLALNDGFNSVEDFFKWFNKDFDGYIIHWTDLEY